MEGRAKTGRGGRLPLVIACAAAGVLAAAYLGACAWAFGRDTILPNVSISGVDVSNLTMEQARNTVEAAVSRAGRDVTLTLGYAGLERSFAANGSVMDTARGVRDAWALGRGNFLTAGPRLLSHFLGASSQVPLELSARVPALDNFVAEMEQAVAGSSENSGYRLEDGRLVMTKGAPVTAIDWDRVRDDVRQCVQDAFDERLSGGAGPVERKLTLSASQDPEEPDFEAIHREVYAEPVNAALDPETMEIAGHTVGLDFDVRALKAAWHGAETGETFSVPLTVTQPKVTGEELRRGLFRDLLGEGTTKVGGSANRKENVRLSAEACNNVILLPGGEFSYNDATGSRTADKGYKDAPTYQAGQSVDDIGGGICQTSSTIYYAVLHTALEVVERHDHQFNTGYVDLGMDATVYFGSLDFRFKNNTDYPIKIVTESYDFQGSRWLNVKIYGTNPEGVRAKPESVAYDRVEPTAVYAADDSVPRGTLVLDREQYAYTGWSAHTYRCLYDRDGNLLEKQDMGISKYNMRPNIYHYNPADGDPSTWADGKPAAPKEPDAAGPGAGTPAETRRPSQSGLTFIDPNAVAG